MLQPSGIAGRDNFPFLFQVMENLSQLNDHKIKLAQLLNTPKLMNNTDISALYDLTETLLEDSCFTVSIDCTGNE